MAPDALIRALISADAASELRGLFSQAAWQLASGGLISLCGLVLILIFVSASSFVRTVKAHLFVTFCFDSCCKEYEWVDRWVQAESAKASATSVVLAAAQRYGGDDVDSDSDEDDDGADSGDPSDGRMPKRSAQRDPLTTFPLPGGRTRRLKRILAADGQTRVVSFNRSPLWVDRTWTSSSGVETIRITVWRRGSEQLMSAVLSAAHALHTETLESDGTSFLTVFEARVPQPGDGAPPHRRRRLRGHSSAADGGGPADGPELRGPELEWQGVAPVPHAVYLRQLVFPPDHFKEVNRMISDMRDFQDLRLWYTQRGIPYHRGYLLTGPSGCGKTLIARVAASELKMELWVLDLSLPQLHDEAIEKLFSQVPPSTIVLLKNVDSMYDKDRQHRAGDVRGDGLVRQGASKDLSFSTLLNVLDGTLAADGVMVIFTAQRRAGELDEALMRPGRCDVVVPVPALTSECAEEIFKRIYRTHPTYGQELKASCSLDKYASEFQKAVEAEVGPGGRVLSMRQLLSYLCTRHPTAAVEEVKDIGASAATQATARRAAMAAPASDDDDDEYAGGYD